MDGAQSGEFTEKVKESAPSVGGIAGDRLRSYVERISRLYDEQRTLAQDVAEVYREAKGAGFDSKVLRSVVQYVRNPGKFDDYDMLRELYLRALGVGERGEPPAVIRVEDMPVPDAPAPAPARAHARNEPARAAGHADGLAGVRDHADRWPSGEPGHGDYEIAWSQGQEERSAKLADETAEEADTLPPAASRARARARASA